MQAEVSIAVAHDDVPDPPFVVRALHLDDDMVVVEIVGGLDIGTAPLVDPAGDSLVADLAAESGMYVRIDLAGLTFCDTAGLDSLSAAIGALEATGAQVDVVGARRQVRRLLLFAADHCWLTNGSLAAAVGSAG
ncbi:MAG TPA: STAS domain-containing protein [Mycobacteriales bacterium]